MALEFAFSSHSNSSQAWVWLPNWSFKAEVFAELAHHLPGQHYWYRWYDTTSFEVAVDEICNNLPDNVILVGWSLGGALAEAVAHRVPDIAGLITFASPPKFCRAKQWPYGMSQVRYESFISSFSNDPNTTLNRFLALNVQGVDKPKVIIRLLAHHQLKPSAALQNQLLWFDQYDFTDLEIAKCHYLHLFADHDALVPAPRSREQGQYETINETCHALFLLKPDLIIQKLQTFHSQLPVAHKSV